MDCGQNETDEARKVQVVTDINRVRELEILSDRYKFLKDNARDIILFIRKDGKIIDVNKNAAAAYGYGYEELLSMNIDQLRATSFNCVTAKESKDEFSIGVPFETLHQRKDGSSFNVEVYSNGTIIGGDYIQLDVIRDITERKEAEEKLYRLSNYDVITDLPNKKYFGDYIFRAIEHAKEEKEMIAVLLVDLDRYKKINDTMGHIIGDKILRTVADRFKTLISDSVFAARAGGDEFIFVQTNVNLAEEAAELAYKILKLIKAPFELDGEEIHITASIGISLYPIHGDDAVSLMKAADISMYRVKNNGRNNYEFYTSGINKEVYENIVIEKSLHHALENNELVLHYQPKFNALTGTVIGMEALVRWQSPTLGLVSPVKFITLAEETGLIVPIGKWVLRTACAQNKLWQDLGYSPMRVAVNLSIRQFEETNLVKLVDEILKETDLNPRYLELEVTETMAIRKMDLIVSTLRKLKDMGIHIALDDFGTGYSSLKYLRNIPIDTVKIDRAFINDINSNPSYGAIIDAILDIANKLKLGVIAEGVETEEQSSFLIGKKCYEMQGFLFSKPVTKEELEAMLTRYPNHK